MDGEEDGSLEGTKTVSGKRQRFGSQRDYGVKRRKVVGDLALRLKNAADDWHGESSGGRMSTENFRDSVARRHERRRLAWKEKRRRLKEFSLRIRQKQALSSQDQATKKKEDTLVVGYDETKAASEIGTETEEKADYTAPINGATENVKGAELPQQQPKKRGRKRIIVISSDDEHEVDSVIVAQPEKDRANDQAKDQPKDQPKDQVKDQTNDELKETQALENPKPKQNELAPSAEVKNADAKPETPKHANESNESKVSKLVNGKQAHVNEKHAHASEKHAHASEKHAHASEKHSHASEKHAHASVGHKHSAAPLAFKRPTVKGKTVTKKKISELVDLTLDSDSEDGGEKVDLEAETAKKLAIAVPYPVSAVSTIDPRLGINRTAVWTRGTNLLHYAAAHPSEIMARGFNLTLTGADLCRLVDGTWLNDEVINFYTSLIARRAEQSDRDPSVFFFNSFFFSQLVKGGYGKVARWTKKVDLFGYHMIMVPINKRSHWLLVVVGVREGLVLEMDSLYQGISDAKIIRNFLRAEAKAKGKQEPSFKCLKVSNIPKQKNGTDCGVFLCMYADTIARAEDPNFTQNDIPLLRRRMVCEIVDGKLMV